MEKINGRQNVFPRMKKKNRINKNMVSYNKNHCLIMIRYVENHGSETIR